jgi:hypothetical protein
MPEQVCLRRLSVAINLSDRIVPINGPLLEMHRWTLAVFGLLVVL